MTHETWAIVPAGGAGRRFSRTHNKLLVPLGGVPLLLRTISSLMAIPSLDGIILVSHPQHQAAYAKQLKTLQLEKPIRWAKGGPSRRDSVYNGLLALPESASIVLIHDAARPLVPPPLFEQVIGMVASGSPAVVVGIPIRDTVKKVQFEPMPRPGHYAIQDTVDRSNLWRAQTPQVFDKALILQAHQSVAMSESVTDDAQLFELAGLPPVTMVEGTEHNLKITTPQDLQWAEILLQSGV